MGTMRLNGGMMSDKAVAAADEAEAADGAAEGEGVVRVPCQIFSRVMGYLRPLESWNVGKRQEFRDRKVYKFQP